MNLSADRGLYIGIYFLSAATLALEISLTRIFSVSLWYHFAFMVVSIAFLGFGASGALLYLFPFIRRGPIRKSICITSLGFSITTILSYILAIRVPLDPIKMALEPTQILFLLIMYLLFSIPFIFSGLTIATAISALPKKVHKIYFSDLLGASTGCLFVIIAFSLLEGTLLIPLCALIGALSSLSFSRSWGPFRWSSILIGGTILVLILWKSPIFEAPISPYKDLSVALNYPGAKHLGTRWNAISRIDIVDSPAVRFAPGLSLRYLKGLPRQIGITVDGDRLNAITKYAPGDPLVFTEYLPSSLPYHLSRIRKVLVVEPMGGLDILIAIHHGAKDVVAVEKNPLLIDIIAQQFDRFTGGIYSGRHEGIKISIGEARSFLHRHKDLFDLIVLPITETLGAASTGLLGFGEDYTFTREAMRTYVSRLSPTGFLSISRYLLPPPRQEIRLVTTLMEAMEKEGIPYPDRHLMIYRSMNTFHLLFKGSPLTEIEIDRFKAFCEKMFFDLIYYPGIRDSEVNRFNRFKRPIYHSILMQVLNPKKRSTFLKGYLFDVAPVSDDRPFFHYFFKFSTLPEVYQSMGQKWQPFIEGGYLIPVILIQATLASFFLILMPAIIARKKPMVKRPSRGGGTLPALSYFVLIGLGFMFVEISLINKVILFLGQPLYALSMVLFAILFFSALGSRWSHKIGAGHGFWHRSNIPLIFLGVLIAIYTFLIPKAFEAFMGNSIFIKAFLTLLFIAPLAFFMGMPFPVGIRYLEETYPDTIPWAWIANACSSVVASILTIFIALSFGFSFCLLLASVAYTAAFFLIKTPSSSPE